MSMVERIIYDVISDGLDWFKADQGQRFERFLLTELRLSVAEAAKGRIYFAGGTNTEGETVEARPPTLVHGFARTGGPFPCWALTLGSESESQVYLNDDAEFLDSEGNATIDPDTGEIVEPKVVRIEYLFNILCITDHPDVTLWYYHLLKRIIRSNHDMWLGNDIDPPTINGADLAPDPRYLPSDVFARQLTLRIEGEECWTEPREGYAVTLSGIAVADTDEELTAGDADGQVTAKVTIDTSGS